MCVILSTSDVFTLLSQMIFLFFFLTAHPESRLILCHLSLAMLPYQNLYSVEMLLFRHLIPTPLSDDQPHLDHYALFDIFLHPSPNSLQVEFSQTTSNIIRIYSSDSLQSTDCGTCQIRILLRPFFFHTALKGFKCIICIYNTIR